MSYLRFVFSLLLPFCLIAQESLPLTPQELAAYMERAEAKIALQLDSFASLPDHQRSYETMMKPWSRLSSELISHFSMLFYLAALDLPVSIASQEAMGQLQGFWTNKCLQNPDVPYAFKAYANAVAGGALSPYERYELLSLLESYPEKNTCGTLQAQLRQETPLPYITWTSPTPPKTAGGDALTLLSLNTCFVPGDFPYLYGGVVQLWQERVAPLTEKLLEVDADVVCLQEVFTLDASYALYEALQGRYSYFYGAISPRTLGFSVETLGMPSGLFVASKYPIIAPQFTPFAKRVALTNQGVFDFILTDGETPLAHIYTTHMMPFNTPPFEQMRAGQLQEIIDKMGTDLAQGEEIPYFLCGDLNILRGSCEPAEELIRTHFHDDYNKQGAETTEANSTYTYYFTNYYLAADKDPNLIDPNFQILDYALLLRASPHSGLSTQRVVMNDLSAPNLALSDHHGLLTELRMGKAER